MSQLRRQIKRPRTTAGAYAAIPDSKMPADISFGVITAAGALDSPSSMLVALNKTTARLVPGGVVVILGCCIDHGRTRTPELYMTTPAERSSALAAARAFVATRDMLELEASDNACVIRRRSSIDVYGNATGACVQWRPDLAAVYPRPLLAVIAGCTMWVGLSLHFFS